MIAQKFLIALVALGPVVAAAQWAPELASTAAVSADEEASPRPRQFGRFAPPSAAEIDDALEFMQENAPNRWQAIQSLPDDGSSLRRNVIGFVVARYRALQGVKEDDPKLYEIKVQELRAEDEVYGLLSDAGTPELREKRRNPLDAAARKMMELTLAERQQRIVRLKEIVGYQEQSLTQDRQQIDAMVTARVEALISDGQAALRDEVRPGGRREQRRERPATQPAPSAPATR